MVKESVAEKLARLNAEAAYDLAQALQYQDPYELQPDPEETPAETESQTVEALRLRAPNSLREQAWLEKRRERGVVPAFKIWFRKAHRLHVLPKINQCFMAGFGTQIMNGSLKITGLRISGPGAPPR